jgi:hypothetical protein
LLVAVLVALEYRKGPKLPETAANRVAMRMPIDRELARQAPVIPADRHRHRDALQGEGHWFDPVPPIRFIVAGCFGILGTPQ